LTFTPGCAVNQIILFQTTNRTTLSKCVHENKNKGDTVQRIYTRACGNIDGFFVKVQTARHLIEGKTPSFYAFPE
jgi:hypothetical protein